MGARGENRALNRAQESANAQQAERDRYELEVSRRNAQQLGDTIRQGAQSLGQAHETKRNEAFRERQFAEGQRQFNNRQALDEAQFGAQMVDKGLQAKGDPIAERKKLLQEEIDRGAATNPAAQQAQGQPDSAQGYGQPVGPPGPNGERPFDANDVRAAQVGNEPLGMTGDSFTDSISKTDERVQMEQQKAANEAKKAEAYYYQAYIEPQLKRQDKFREARIKGDKEAQKAVVSQYRNEIQDWAKVGDELSKVQMGRESTLSPESEEAVKQTAIALKMDGVDQYFPGAVEAIDAGKYNEPTVRAAVRGVQFAKTIDMVATTGVIPEEMPWASPMGQRFQQTLQVTDALNQWRAPFFPSSMEYYEEVNKQAANFMQSLPDTIYGGASGALGQAISGEQPPMMQGPQAAETPRFRQPLPEDQAQPPQAPQPEPPQPTYRQTGAPGERIDTRTNTPIFRGPRY
jgi:hypothetical protein